MNVTAVPLKSVKSKLYIKTRLKIAIFIHNNVFMRKRVLSGKEQTKNINGTTLDVQYYVVLITIIEMKRGQTRVHNQLEMTMLEGRAFEVRLPIRFIPTDP